ncbi:MAG: hypothetical protein VX833_06795 [Actinomycetota bacterium]|nr:hypothetical protein [Actinomycetota bacterium]
MGATEMGDVPVLPENRVWRHPSEIGRARRVARRRRRRTVLVLVGWVALLVAGAAIGFGAVTD